MNKVVLSGNIVRDPEIRYTQSGKAVATLSIAVNRGWKKAENSNYPTADFFTIVAWDKLAEFCSKYLSKSSRILVEGRLQSRTYDAQDGSKRYITEVVANEIEFAGARPSGGSNYNANYNNNNDDPAAFLTEFSKSKAKEASSSSGETKMNEEDVPF